MPTKQIILVGHCGFDSSHLTHFVKELTDTPINSANSPDELEQITTPDSLLLINRVLPSTFNQSTGIDLIAQLNEAPNPPKSILISDYDDAQEQALAAGALPGFGKSSLSSSQSIQRFTDALQ